MDLRDELSALKSRAKEQLSLLNTKQKSEQALLLPFFALLGYHPFDVREVEPGYTIELDGGRERRIDYALKKGGSLAILVQSKEIGTNLNAYEPAPLLRSLKKSEARVGAVTDGVDYRFYADLEGFYSVLKGTTASDRRPFLHFSIFHHENGDVEDLRRLTKPDFDADGILAFAHRLKYKRLFRDYLTRQAEEPDEEFVRFLTEQIHHGEASKGDPGMYESSVREALRQMIETQLAEEGSETQSTGGEEIEKPVDEDDLSEGNNNGESREKLSFEEYFEQGF